MACSVVVVVALSPAACDDVVFILIRCFIFDTGRNLRSLRGVLGVPTRMGGLTKASELNLTPP